MGNLEASLRSGTAPLVSEVFPVDWFMNLPSKGWVICCESCDKHPEPNPLFYTDLDWACVDAKERNKDHPGHKVIAVKINKLKSELGKGEKRMDKIPRRNKIYEMVPAELKIREAIQSVEEMGADPVLTDAVILLGQAQDKVADFVDRKES